jgi:hypothetical protein
MFQANPKLVPNSTPIFFYSKKYLLEFFMIFGHNFFGLVSQISMELFLCKITWNGLDVKHGQNRCFVFQNCYLQ